MQQQVDAVPIGDLLDLEDDLALQDLKTDDSYLYNLNKNVSDLPLYDFSLQSDNYEKTRRIQAQVLITYLRKW